MLFVVTLLQETKAVISGIHTIKTLWMDNHQAMYILLFHFLYILQGQTKGDDLVASTKTLNHQLTNIVFYNDSIYVAGSGTLFKLNHEDLTLTATASTCPSVGCEDVNKILLLIKGRDEVLMCGTGNEGLCFIRSIDDNTFGNITRNQTNQELHSVMKVSSDRDRPAQAVITNDGRVIIAVTFGLGITVDFKDRLTYTVISTRALDQNFGYFQSVGSKLHLNLSSSVVRSLEDYVIYFKGSFQTEDFNYFLTNQKEFVGGKKIVSKIIRLCQNDANYGTYVDIELQCGDSYNIIQDVNMFSLNATDAGRLFIGTFTDGLTQDSAICVTFLRDINTQMKLEQKQFAMNSCYSINDSQRYLANHFRQCAPENVVHQDIYTCHNPLKKFKYVIGNTPLKMTPKFQWNAANGFITTVYGTLLNGTEPVVFAGTSKGNVLKFYHYGDNNLLLYDNISLHAGFPIRHISQQGENMYVMSDKKLFKFSSSRCSFTDSCLQIKSDRNPLCGWCVLENKATRRSECSNKKNHWLSFIQGCVSISTTPKGFHIGTQPQNVTIHVINIPEDCDKIYCNLVTPYTVSIGSRIPASRDGSNLICTVTVFPQDVTHAILQLWINSYVQATTDFLFYMCSNFTKCRDCVGFANSHCVWCSESTMCRSNKETCTPNGKSITQLDQCPQLMPTEVYVHADVKTNVTFKGMNLPSQNKQMQCVNVNFPIPAVRHDSISVTCELNISLPQTSKKDTHQVTIKYNGNSALDDVYNINVTVYRCEKLASDCTHCTHLNKTRYNCTWCNGNCVYSGVVCNSVCPAPNIIKVIPHDGPIQGGTVLTITGTELGQQVTSNMNVMLADTACNIQQYTSSKDPDYEQLVHSLIYCTTGVLKNTSTVNKPWSLNVVVDRKGKMQNVSFTYQIPTVTALEPRSGPRSGGTKITLSGSYLGIGNRNVTVKIGDTDCLDARVVPPVALDASGENNAMNYFNICCTTDGEKLTAVGENISLFMNDASVFNLSLSGEIGFSFKEDPKLERISITKAFLSGGTSFKVHGTLMTNANKGKVTSTYGDDTQVEKCDIVSAVQAICKVPNASKSVWDELNHRRQKHSPSDCGIKVPIVVSLDGVKEEFMITYFKNPVIDRFDNNILRIRNSDRKISIMGQNLNLAATMEDFYVTVGGEQCSVINLTATNLECSMLLSYPPTKNPPVEIMVQV